MSSSSDLSSDSDVDDLVDQVCNRMKMKLKTMKNEFVLSKFIDSMKVSHAGDCVLDSDNEECISTKSISSDTKNSLSPNSIGFIIDKEPCVNVEEQIIDVTNSEDDDMNINKRNKHSNREKQKGEKKKKVKNRLATALEADISLEDSYINMDLHLNDLPGRKKEKATVSKLLKQTNKDKEIMSRSVITPDFEKKDSIPPYEEGLRQLKKQRKIEREKTKGKGWFEMPATEMTEEKKNDLTVLQMRRSLDPKRFYKANDIKTLPKYFQFGTVIESAADFYHSRIPKKQRKSTMVDELLADAEFRRYNKRKYVEIQETRRKGAGPYKHMKRLKKKKK